MSMVVPPALQKFQTSCISRTFSVPSNTPAEFNQHQTSPSPSDPLKYSPTTPLKLLKRQLLLIPTIPYSARVAIAISVPVGVFLIGTLLLTTFYVHRQTAPTIPPPQRKHMSKSTTTWSPSPAYNHRTPIQKRPLTKPKRQLTPPPVSSPLKTAKSPYARSPSNP
ncbi:hypothetical protein ABVK25_011374 [Lepraria finkii]|uniref:Uncharacterized protein n=1 Tax=Lepraria finkii TaxID=1340010 RepID=A0ABR4ASD9_9LECA